MPRNALESPYSSAAGWLRPGWIGFPRSPVYLSSSHSHSLSINRLHNQSATMRLHSSSPLVFLASLLPGLTAASGFDCAHIRVDGIEYDLSPLAGVHSLYHVEETEDVVVNTTYVLNICSPLKGAAIRGKAKCGTSKNSMLPAPWSLPTPTCAVMLIRIYS